MVDATVVIGSTLATTLLLLLISGQIHDTTDGNLMAQSPAAALETVITVPAMPQPSASFARPSRSTAMPSPAPSTVEISNTPDDTAIQAAIDEKIQDDPDLSALGITATVTRGKVILAGTAPTDELKDKVEKLARAVRGVKQVDNQIVVISNA